MGFSRSASTAIKATLCLSLVLGSVSVSVHAARTRAGALPPLVILDQATGSWVRNFNPFVAAAALDPTKAGIYEPLFIVSIHDNARVYPWLATNYAWADGNRTLTFTIRQGVKWSDGKPFSVDDVAYTLNAGKTNAALDQAGLWGKSGLVRTITQSGNTISIHFKAVDTTEFDNLVNNLYIVPKHIWASIKDPLHFTNQDPVGTGPFTQVQNFSSQSYDVAKNPNYWQSGKPAVQVLRFTAHTGNDSELLDLKAGKVDWSGNFLPNAAAVFDKLNPNFHHYYSPSSTAVQLYFNLAKYPFNVPDFRKALSMGINRQALSISAEYGYAPPSDVTGIAGMYPSWVDKSIPNTLVQYNPTVAKALLRKAGFTLKGGSLIDPRGKAVSFDINVVNGWTDWDAGATIMAQNFRDLGINAGTHQSAFGDWFSHLVAGQFDVQMSWSDRGATPYTFYQHMLSRTFYSPVGTPNYSGANWDRYKMTWTDALLTQFRSTTDLAKQHRIANELQQVVVGQFPTIPLFYGPIWEDYNTTTYTGFPDASHYYASGQPADTPDRLLVLTTVHPSH